MKRVMATMVLSLATSLPLTLQAELAWHSEPPPGTAAPGQGSGTHGGHGGRGAGARLYLHGLLDTEVAEAWLTLPTQVQRPLAVSADGAVAVPSTGLDNYHRLQAVQRSEGRLETALHYRYMHGKPSGYSPARLFDQASAELEIVPAPLPREHSRYLSGREVEFILLFRGEPWVNAPVVLSTANGSQRLLKSGADGRLRLSLPDDFTEVKPGRRANPAADFTLRVERKADGVHYATTLSAPYYTNPEHWQSRWGGLAAMGVGFVGGLLVVGRRQRRAEA